MSVKYKAVNWNRNKVLYDGMLVLLVAVYIAAFLEIAPQFARSARDTDPLILQMRAFGTCAFLLLTLVLSIGPAARIDRRFLPFLYNRRHFGVVTAGVASLHAMYVLEWYFNFSPINPYAAVLGSNTSYTRFLGFPFEAFGIVALLILLVLATTSHDFWLSFMTPPIWKAVHMSVYFAYTAVIAHIALGYLQDGDNSVFVVLSLGSSVLVTGLHVIASRRDAYDEAEHASGVYGSSPSKEWVHAGDPLTIEDGQARLLMLEDGEKIAIFRKEDRLFALSNACAHQNGPLGEGRILEGCVTCPWHGYQYRPEDGCSPPPFSEKVATYNLKIEEHELFVARKANTLGTRTDGAFSPTSRIQSQA